MSAERTRGRFSGLVRRVLCALLGLASAALLSAAGFHASVHLLGERAYASLQQNVVRDDSGAPQLEWDELLQANEDVVAWVEVDGTSIALPVVAPRTHSVEWYMDHDLWGNWSTLGCLVLSQAPVEGSVASQGRAVVFGHHLSGTTLMLSDLADCWQQGRFDELGSCWWCEPDGTVLRLAPVFATRTDATDVLYLEQPEERPATDWLSAAQEQASARSSEPLANGDTPFVLSFVTCSSELARLDGRCAVTFACASSAPE